MKTEMKIQSGLKFTWTAEPPPPEQAEGGHELLHHLAELLLAELTVLRLLHGDPAFGFGQFVIGGVLKRVNLVIFFTSGFQINCFILTLSVAEEGTSH